MTFRGESVWTKIQSAFKTYVTEASDLGGMDVECPECHTVVPDEEWRPDEDAEGDIAMWTHLCKCGTTMKVFND